MATPPSTVQSSGAPTHDEGPITASVGRSGIILRPDSGQLISRFVERRCQSLAQHRVRTLELLAQAAVVVADHLDGGQVQLDRECIPLPAAPDQAPRRDVLSRELPSAVPEARAASLRHDLDSALRARGLLNEIPPPPIERRLVLQLDRVPAVGAPPLFELKLKSRYRRPIGISLHACGTLGPLLQGHLQNGLVQQVRRLDLRADLLQLASANGGWQLAADALREASAAAAADPHSAAELRRLEGRINEEQLGDWAAAFEAHLAASELLPNDAPTLAESFANPPTAIAGLRSNETAPLEVEDLDPVRCNHFVVDTIKPAEDGCGVIVRGHETKGSRGRARLRIGFMDVAEACRCDLLEAEIDEPVLKTDVWLEFGYRPYEIITMRLC